MAMRKEKPKSAAYIKKKNKELQNILHGMLEEFGADKIKEVANDVGFDLFVLNREIGDSEMSEVWPAVVSFVAITLGKIDKDKARKVLVNAGIPAADVAIFIGC